MLLERAGQSLKGAASFRRLSEQTRSIHIPRRVVPPSSPTNLVHRTRALFARLATHLQGPPISRSVHSSPSIRQSLSLPARIALSRPLRAPCLPRAPRVPGNVTQVGLGTARNFSSARPIFQHLVENVPVTGRAFYEVDWDLKMRQEKDSMTRRHKKANRKAKLADKLAPKPEPFATVTSYAQDEEVQHYFQTLPTPLVTTYLQIPLAPTPTSRVPLSSSPSSPGLLPLPALAKEHASHSKHAIRVSSLFRRLDAAQVWNHGASCETFGDPLGLCTILRIKFEGWSEARVREILGEAGKDWCTIQELSPTAEIPYGEDSLSSGMTQSASSEPISSMGNELPSGISLVMPTLDFSSSFASASSPSLSSFAMSSSPRGFSDGESDYSFPSEESAWDEDSVSDTSSSEPSLASSVDEWSSAARSSPSPSWLSFSSDFARRASYPPGDMF